MKAMVALLSAVGIILMAIAVASAPDIFKNGWLGLIVFLLGWTIKALLEAFDKPK